MEKFRKLGLSEEVIKTLESMGIDTPSGIQEQAIPFALEGRDIVGASKTGSGKTLAFASAIIEKIVPEKKVKAIVLTPTRELAEQVSMAIQKFSKDNLKVLAVYGGVNMETQTRKMRNLDILVGTPGRILDHLKRGTLRLDNVEILVLDEFDRMLDMGFIYDVEKIISSCPKKRQTMLFSATISPDVDHIAEKHTINPIEISVESHVDHTQLKQIYYDVPDGLKFSLLVHLLKDEKSGLVMIFCSTRRNADFVVSNLNRHGIEAKAIHGGLDQKKRIKVLEEFHKSKTLDILVCTDVAARGLDIKGVTHVYNYDLPSESNDYIHRIGRTARAGENGIAINILSSRDYENFSNIVNHEKVKIDQAELPYVKRVEIQREERSRGRRDTGRRSNDTRGRDSGRRSNDTRGNNPRRGDDSRRDDRRPPRQNSGRSFGGSQTSRGRVELFDAVCMKCNKPCKVPFKPISGKGVSCSNCFVPKDSGPRGGNSRGGDRRGRDSGRRNDSRGGSSRGSDSTKRFGGRDTGKRFNSRDSRRESTRRGPERGRR